MTITVRAFIWRRKRSFFFDFFYIINASFLSVSCLIDLSLAAVGFLPLNYVRTRVSYRELSAILFMVGQLIELVAPQALARY
jgi:hypothetical protein